MALEHITGLSDENVALLIEYFQNKPRLEALLRSYLDRCQEAEDELWDVIESRMIENAVGGQLDVLGDIVGQPRIGATDEIYRLHIRARIRINRSNGNSNDVLAVTFLLLQTSRFRFLEYYPASFVIDVLDPMVEDPAFVASLIGEARGAGIGHSLHYSFDEEDETFAFSETNVEQADAFRGMSDTSVDASGGQLISVI